MHAVRRDLRKLAELVGPRALVVVVVACALVGAAVGAVAEAVHQFGLPLSPKGTPPA